MSEPVYTTPPLASMTSKAQTIALEWWELGYLDGQEAGYRRAIADDEAAWARMRETIRDAARSPDLATLQRRRGQHDRAEATEALWQERGISA